MKHDLVIGYNHGYTWEKIEPFARSLRDTGFDGDISLFTSGVAADAVAEIESRGVKVLSSPCRNLAGSERWLNFWKALRVAPVLCRLRILQCIAPVGVRRFLLYEKHLATYAAQYRRAFLTDVRDVVFQKNPFETKLPRGVHAFEEDGRHTVATRPINAGWVREAFGADGLHRLGPLPILCAGTILGDVPELISFLRHFAWTCAKSRYLKSAGIDQGIYNMAVRTYPGPAIHLHANGGVVLTMAIMPASDILVDEQGHVLGADGRIIPVLHQFDRHPQLFNKIKVLQGNVSPPATSRLPVAPGATDGVAV